MVQLMQKVPVPKRRRREMHLQGVETFLKNGKINIEKKKHFFEKEAQATFRTALFGGNQSGMRPT